MDQAAVDKLLDSVRTEAEALSASLSCDVIFFSGDLRWSVGYELVTTARKRRKNDNVLIVPVTDGGSPDTAYRMARYLQNEYKEVYAFVPSNCKSAGTLLISGAHKIYMGELGELGPLDIQRSKKDELWEYSSGLNVDATILTLQETASKMFFDYLHQMKQKNSSATYRTAAELSVALTSQLLSPIYAQIDPAEIGENRRSMDITMNYAKRLDQKSRNFKSRDSLNFLVESYPDHGFVIDRVEAAEIFTHVLSPTDQMIALEVKLGKLAHEPLDWERGIQYEVRFLSPEPPAKLSVVSGTGSGAVP